MNWLGFHVVLLIGAGVFCLLGDAGQKHRRQGGSPYSHGVLWLGWGFALIGVRRSVGAFFRDIISCCFPRWRFRRRVGLSLIRSRTLIAIALVAMTVPLIRFGPRYAMLSTWNDLALDRDSREASRIALKYAPPGGSLYVWGYRPEMYVYTGLRPASRFLECQALTGVPADRHRTSSVNRAGLRARSEAREELASLGVSDVLIDGSACIIRRCRWVVIRSCARGSTDTTRLHARKAR